MFAISRVDCTLSTWEGRRYTTYWYRGVFVRSFVRSSILASMFSKWEEKGEEEEKRLTEELLCYAMLCYAMGGGGGRREPTEPS